MWFVLVGFLIALSIGATTREARADWQPRDVTTAQAALEPILVANAKATGGLDPHFAQRREQWTYVNGARRLAVAVAIRGADFRTSLELDGLTYTAGRKAGAHWRGDGNGMAHGVEADLQGDALDRPPQAVFALDPAICTLADEARLPAPAWVVKTHPDGDKPVFLYSNEAHRRSGHPV